MRVDAGRVLAPGSVEFYVIPPVVGDSKEGGLVERREDGRDGSFDGLLDKLLSLGIVVVEIGEGSSLPVFLEQALAYFAAHSAGLVVALVVE